MVNLMISRVEAKKTLWVLQHMRREIQFDERHIPQKKIYTKALPLVERDQFNL